MLLTEVKASQIKSNEKQKSRKTILFWKTLDGSFQLTNFLVKTQKNIIGQINKLVEQKSIGGLRGKLNKMKRFSLCR